jgi:outer membrane lipoprotein-sorting protein
VTTLRSAVALLLLGVIAAGGCAPTSTTRTGTRNVTPELVHQSVRNNQERVRSLKGSGYITVESPEIAQTGSFELMLRKPDSVLVKFEGPFGLDVGAALLTRSEFFFYNSLQNRLISGSMSRSNLGRILRVDVTFEELLNLLTGGTFFSEDQDAPESFSMEDDQFVLTYTHNGGSRRYWVDPSSLLIGKIEHFDRQGKPIFEQHFRNFRSVEGTSLPYHVRVLQLRERRAIALSFSSILINANELRFSLDVPKNAQRVRWQ